MITMTMKSSSKYIHPLTRKILRVSEWAIKLENEWDKLPDTRKFCPHWDDRNHEYPKSKRHSNSRYNYSMIEMADMFCNTSLISLQDQQNKLKPWWRSLQDAVNYKPDIDIDDSQYDSVKKYGFNCDDCDYEEYYEKQYLKTKENFEICREQALRDLNHNLCHKVNRTWDKKTRTLTYTDCKFAKWFDIGHHQNEGYEEYDIDNHYECKDWYLFEHLNPYWVSEGRVINRWWINRQSLIDI